MRFGGRSVVVTGAGQGIGRAIAQHFAAEGARLFLCDLDRDAIATVARDTGAGFMAGDLRHADVVDQLVDQAEADLGQIDIFLSNAGFARGEPSHAASAPDEVWQDMWDLHVMAHVRAARRVLPEMIARGSGHLVQVASAAGLLSQIGDAAYSATKHAAVSVAQSLAITHGDDGIDVSVVCPLYVATPLLGYDDDSPVDTAGVIGPDDVARAALDGIAEGRFMILPHPEAAEFARSRTADFDRWVLRMRTLRSRALAACDSRDLRDLHRFI